MKRAPVDYSRILPNSFSTPNLLVDEIMRYISGDELKCYMLVCRKTFGWRKEDDAIALGQICEYAGLSKEAASGVMQSLVSFGLVVIVAENNPLENKGRRWKIELDDRKIKWALLQSRVAQKKALNKQRTLKANLSKVTPPRETRPPHVDVEEPPHVAHGTQKTLNNKRHLPEEFPIDWKVGSGVSVTATPEAEFEANVKDIANLFEMGCAGAGEIAAAFMRTRGILFTTEKVKAQRKVAKSLLEQGVKPQHVEEATRTLMNAKDKSGRPYIIVTLSNIESTAVSLANPAPTGNKNTTWTGEGKVVL